MDHLITMQPLNESQFVSWQKLMEERSGLYLPEKRRSFLEAQLAMRMREIGYDDHQNYLDLVSKGANGAIEWQVLIDRLTVHETRFFRDPDAFALIESHIKSKAKKHNHKQSFECWSVGCSTGEEAYSLAFIADRYLGKADKHYAITGTDISQEVLHKARLGIYSDKALDMIPPGEYQDLFTHHGNKIQIAQHVRNRCCFTKVNLLKLAEYPLHSQQVISCQNVLIYFRRWRRREILNILADRLVPGGLLITGLGDLVDYQHPLLEQVPSTTVSAYIRKTNNNMESAGQ